MEQPAAPEKNSRQRLMQSILDLGDRAFNPERTQDAQAQQDFDDLIQRQAKACKPLDRLPTKTLGLIAALNILIWPGHSPPWLRARLVGILTQIPLRHDGVRATLEVVFSVHPSSTVRTSEAAVPQKRGANITHEGLKMASNLISSCPASVTPETWYTGISAQLLPLLDGAEGPELMKAVSYIIGFGILGRKVSGAPGTAGWKYLAEPMLREIRPPPGGLGDSSADVGVDGIVDLSSERVMVKHDDLVTALQRLHTLAVSHPNPGLCKRLLSPLLLPLWAFASWPNAQPPMSDKISAPALELLKIYLKLASSSQILMTLVRSLGYVGGRDAQSPEWVYKETKPGELQVVDARRSMGKSSLGGGGSHQMSLQDIDQKTPKLLELITSSCSDDDISTAFLHLFAKWLDSARGLRGGVGGDIKVKEEESVVENSDPITQLTEIKVLQAMMERFPEKLANQPKQIFKLVSQVLAGSQVAAKADEEDSDDDVAGVSLSLLNMIITMPGFQKSKADPDVMQSIESSLATLSKTRDHHIARTATNLGLLLKYRDELDNLSPDASSSTPTAPTDRQLEDRKTYRLAISYITAPDSPPPVRSEGLVLISTLITANSPVLDIPGILVLTSSLMRDADDYINLRAISMFTLVANRHPRAVAAELLDHYVDARETEPVDARLRFGEALLQVVQRLGETFAGDVARQVAEALLAVAGRRGRRPKTEARQQREEKLRRMKNKEAEEAWGGEVPDLSEDLTVEEEARREVLARIVEGWESKRGEEDVRVRASALAVLGEAMEVNVAGLGAGIVAAAVDLCVSVLEAETEVEKGILRRAAVLLVMSFVRALDRARRERRRLGFGLGFGAAAQEDVVRVLGYVERTDNDGLVRQHARDVMEALETWRVKGLVPVEVEEGDGMLGIGGGGGGGLTRLAGLDIDPGRSVSLGMRTGGGEGGGRETSRPRIEEIE
ncbi:hypothetical protein B0T17DRAFT_485048 [Bombardia bombarda]|uniref:RNA polymerase II assembly factor Rtp1 C-terminal domain-containing protein n=1 Tax=Bombardia bombarda TaxID=252184 RepID=A0AA39XJB2_9PEZI|nr:hypothetical protein B0T17DRAFT_485048 [Bombardia bombarda]